MSFRSAGLQRSWRSAGVAGLLGAAWLVAACAGPPALHVPVPDGPGHGCAVLHEHLPDDVGGRHSRRTTPSSVRTAAWGDPAVVLRCGVRRPSGLTQRAQLVEVDGVDWYLVERPSAYVFTASGRRAYVEVRVPAAAGQAAATGPLVDLARAIKRTLPPTPRRLPPG